MPSSLAKPLHRLCLALLALSACSPPARTLEALARSGDIEADAPVKADASLTIAAPPARIWALLAGIDRWPSWRPEVDAAALNGPLRPGTTFRWQSGGLTVRSRLSLVRPTSMIAWRGRALGLDAVHVWTLTPQPDGRILVRTRESMDGFPMTLLFPSAKLQASDAAWLADLKRAAEH